MNLPQSRLAVIFGESAARVAREYFTPQSGPADLPPPLEKLLVSSLPANFQSACAEIVAGWGSEAGSQVWTVRLLTAGAGQAWLAFRCGSNRLDMSQYSDERLGVLSLDTGKLEFLALGEDAENDTMLYHAEFAERLNLEVGEAVAFRIARSNDNPCCGGPEAISEEKLMLFAASPKGIREVFSFVTSRQHDSHDDVDGDTQTTSNTEVHFERDSHGRVTSIVGTFREEEKDVTWNGAAPKYHSRAQRTATLHYRWNPTRFRFEEVK